MMVQQNSANTGPASPRCGAGFAFQVRCFISSDWLTGRLRGIGERMKITEVQTARKWVLGVAVCISLFVFAVSNSTLDRGIAIDKLIEWLGIVAIVICIAGRTWCSMYIGGRKIEELIMIGPYSIVRNPLYVFSIIGAMGAGAQHGSIVVALALGVVAWLVFYVVTLQEERVMAERYGAAFAAYQASVPRFLPKPSLWHDVPVLTIMPPKVVRTFGDAMFFLLVIPLADAFEHLQSIGILPVLFRLP
jgi:protein-S-isoprenylcysteine O-methyltransferase Ste14